MFIDGSIIRAHQHSTGAATTDSECIGKSRGGNSTKIHLAVDSNGLPIYFELSEGQRNDITHAQSLVEHTPQAETVIAAKGYDSDIFRKFIESEGMESVIPKRKYIGEKQKDVDWCLYKYRHLVENAFGRINDFRSISTRYDKLARNYASMYDDVVTDVLLSEFCTVKINTP